MTARNILMAAAGGSTDTNYIEDVFSTYLYTGNDSTQTITNGIDLAGEGGMVWIKNRGSTADHALYDTARGANNWLSSNTTSQLLSIGSPSLSFAASGFNLTGAGVYSMTNANAATYASWTFRKQPKFFDVVTYTGDGTNFRSIAHNLGSKPGCVIIKRTDATADWKVGHFSDSTLRQLTLNSTNAAGNTNWTGGSVDNASDSTFTVFNFGSTVAAVNASGGTYVAYLFAHNAGGFGLTGTDNVISCGSYTGNGSTTGPLINLGYEPQWLMVKRAVGGTGAWTMVDNMRGFSVSGSRDLSANFVDQEFPHNYLGLNATGFQPISTSSSVNTSGSTYIYIAIRRGPMKVPTTGTSAFAPIYVASSTTGAARTSGFPSDLVLGGRTNSNDSLNNWYFIDRLRGMLAQTDDANGAVVQKKLISSSTAAETTSQSPSNYPILYSFGNTDAKQGLGENFIGNGGNLIYYFFRRAPGFFDQVCYTGTGVAGQTFAHNLGVAPELIIQKPRTGVNDWTVYHASLGNTYQLRLNYNITPDGPSSVWWNNTSPTDSVFSVGSSTNTNPSGVNCVAYLFASCPGVSKVGSYTGNGSSQTINCSFTAGARFIMIKRTNSTGDWYVWDTARGIVTANDPRLSLNTITAQVTTDDSVDPASSGFIVNQLSATNINVNGGNYVFLAIA
jgi:hypothetical protein